jgi:hypothetical protein
MTTPFSWLFIPIAIEGEIFSSYLARVAHANGLSPYRFFAFHFPRFPVWNRDIDRSVSDHFLSAIAIRCNKSFEEIENMTLRGFEGPLRGQIKAKAQNLANIAPWINAVGIFNRDRRGFGMQYCPSCLAIDQAYKAIWRLSFVTVCKHHRQPLLDCCQYCDAPIVFHRNETFHINCHRCGRSLTYNSRFAYNYPQIDARLMLQNKLLATIDQGYGSICDNHLKSGELFSGITILMRVVRAQFRRKRREKSRDDCVTCPTQRIELLRVQDRAHQCQILAELIYDWPDRFLRLAASLGLTQKAFKNEVHCPPWIYRTITLLPEGVTRVRTTTIEPIRKKLRSIHRNKKKNWHTERARLLLKNARVKL